MPFCNFAAVPASLAVLLTGFFTAPFAPGLAVVAVFLVTGFLALPSLPLATVFLSPPAFFTGFLSPAGFLSPGFFSTFLVVFFSTFFSAAGFLSAVFLSPAFLSAGFFSDLAGAAVFFSAGFLVPAAVFFSATAGAFSAVAGRFSAFLAGAAFFSAAGAAAAGFFSAAGFGASFLAAPEVEAAGFFSFLSPESPAGLSEVFLPTIKKKKMSEILIGLFEKQLHGGSDLRENNRVYTPA